MIIGSKLFVWGSGCTKVTVVEANVFRAKNGVAGVLGTTGPLVHTDNPVKVKLVSTHVTSKIDIGPSLEFRLHIHTHNGFSASFITFTCIAAEINANQTVTFVLQTP